MEQYSQMFVNHRSQGKPAKSFKSQLKEHYASFKRGVEGSQICFSKPSKSSKHEQPDQLENQPRSFENQRKPDWQDSQLSRNNASPDLKKTLYGLSLKIEQLQEKLEEKIQENKTSFEQQITRQYYWIDKKFKQMKDVFLSSKKDEKHSSSSKESVEQQNLFCTIKLLEECQRQDFRQIQSKLIQHLELQDSRRSRKYHAIMNMLSILRMNREDIRYLEGILKYSPSNQLKKREEREQKDQHLLTFLSSSPQFHNSISKNSSPSIRKGRNRSEVN